MNFRQALSPNRVAVNVLDTYLENNVGDFINMFEAFLCQIHHYVEESKSTCQSIVAREQTV